MPLCCEFNYLISTPTVKKVYDSVVKRRDP